jgi:NAD(P)H-dependent FMN reductase
MNLRQQLLENVPGGPLGRVIAVQWLRGKTPAQIAKFGREHAPKDASDQWEKVEAADGLAFIAPVYLVAVPSDPQGVV